MDGDRIGRRIRATAARQPRGARRLVPDLRGSRAHRRASGVRPGHAAAAAGVLGDARSRACRADLTSPHPRIWTRSRSLGRVLQFVERLAGAHVGVAAAAIVISCADDAYLDPLRPPADPVRATTAGGGTHAWDVAGARAFRAVLL